MEKILASPSGSQTIAEAGAKVRTPLSAPARPDEPMGRDADGSEIPDVPIYRLSVAQYHAMAHADILGEDDPVELLDGWLVQKMTKKRPHSAATGLVRQAFERFVGDGWFVDLQEPVTLADGEPEPDVSVVRGQRREYRERHPLASEVPLVVEVAESSLRLDRGRKKRAYARAKIPIYWILNLIDRQIEVYSDPSGTGRHADYQTRHDFLPEASISVVLDGVTIGTLPVMELFP